MASSSSARQWRHSVFLSFSGEDVRDNLISFLYRDLCKILSDIYVDYRLEPAEEIEPALAKAIDRSRIAVIIFSESYASSTWCLKELEKIIDCNKIHGQMVIPVFYNVDSSHVHDPMAGIYAKAFAGHEKDFKEKLVKVRKLKTTMSKVAHVVAAIFFNALERQEKQLRAKLDQVQRWKDAMIRAANFKGWDAKILRPDTALVDTIVKHILMILVNESPSNSEGLVGIDSSIRQIKDLLSLQSEDVRLLSIWGMGGIGKTTTMIALFKQIYFEFEASSILENIRQEIEKPGGLRQLRRKLLSDILGEENMVSHIEYTSLFGKRKVLIILDDLINLEQLITLIGDKSWLGPGSRVIITSRDNEVFGKKGILGDEVHVMRPYELKELTHIDSLKIFAQNAFIHAHLTDDFWSLTNSFVEYAGGVPLALVVLGRHLRGRCIDDWKISLSNLKNGPRKEIQDVLRLSYDGLSEDGQHMFLDVACFFIGETFKGVKRVFKVCEFSEDLRYLVDKGLIIIRNDEVRMHHLLQEMGRHIERKSNKRKRFWNHEDIYKIFKRKQVWKSIKSISLDMSQATEELKLDGNAFVRTPNLKYLKVYYSKNDGEMVRFPQGLEFFPDELVYLYWHGYPLKSLPRNLDPEQLVVLRLPHSELLWEEEERPETCRLNAMAGSLTAFNSLVQLDLRGNRNIRNFSSNNGLKVLEILNLSECPLMEFPNVPRNIKELSLRRTLIKEVPSSVESLDKLEGLNLSFCPNLTDIPVNVLLGTSLEELFVEGSENVRSLTNLGTMDSLSHDDIPSIELLHLDGTGIESLPACIKQFSSLRFLYLTSCKSLKSLPELPPSLEVLSTVDCSALETISSLRQLFDLREHLSCSHKFDFVNCFKVEQNSWTNLFPYIMRTIKDLSMDDTDDATGDCRLHICYPGSQIPESFASSDDGTPVTVELLPDCDDDHILGFVLCAVFGPGTYNFIQCECHFRKGNGDIIAFSSIVRISGRLKSEHVILWYDHHLWALRDRAKDILRDGCKSISFNFSVDRHERIKKCAVYPLYKKKEDVSIKVEHHHGLDPRKYKLMNTQTFSTGVRKSMRKTTFYGLSTCS